MKILKITLSLLFFYFIYWAFGDKPKLDETKMPKIIIPPGKEPSRVEYPDGRIDLNRDSIDYWKIK
ncbi:MULTISPECIES: hypothetical protein [Photorhabdus]|uniref:hypothetical protein n=1 Tax=Photorhabdus TaxID=29487 RepID=UPI000DCBA4C0|nr:MULTISPECIES: hypothetical protein [Photorhabdus]MCT8344949.1 hypothetical protein [Photorhabdus kleinii]RAX00797.1 hypothetical protein CKY03_07515 [Photorhabdus sp. S9-53]RAX01000.1 hypothetical protein CKY05_07375 [Photorhabdus sp. S10-54]RAX05339.1 hypothetical protein CKY04_05585 [Photorhabdus sp. S8-52]